MELNSYLPQLTNLKQLRLDTRHFRLLKSNVRRNPIEAELLWPGIDNGKQLAARYAQFFHSICSSLQFIQISFWAWRVTGEIDTDFKLRSNPYTASKLQELDLDESLAIELFEIDTLNLQCGLVSTIQNDYDEDIN